VDRKRDTASRKKLQPDAAEASPHRLVGMAYDLAISACDRKDKTRSIRSINRLRDVMRSAGPEDSSDLMVFYDWCLERIRCGEFVLAAETLSDLRKAWETAERLYPG
jgi:flagellin-specific chaperone FliS